MKILKILKIKLSHLISNSPDFVYNSFRSLLNVLDRINININFLLNRKFLLVYQQGRVASTSIFESLLLMGGPYVMFHVHSLGITDLKKKQNIGNEKKRIDRNLMVGEMLSKKVLKISTSMTDREPWKIITVTREPISLILSTLFLNSRQNFGELYVNGELDKDMVLERVSGIFINEDPMGWDICHWFEDEMAKSLDIDIHNLKFNPEDPFFIINDKNFNILILRFEDLKCSFKKGVSSLLNISESSAVLLHSNPHKDNTANNVHRYVSENLKLPEAVCRNIYSSWYVRQFYSDEMINTFVEKWSLSVK